MKPGNLPKKQMLRFCLRQRSFPWREGSPRVGGGHLQQEHDVVRGLFELVE